MEAKDACIRWFKSALERRNLDEAAAAASRERERELTTAIADGKERERDLEAQTNPRAQSADR